MRHLLLSLDDDEGDDDDVVVVVVVVVVGPSIGAAADVDVSDVGVDDGGIDCANPVSEELLVEVLDTVNLGVDE